ncbi:MAG TPA: hypothetical protein VM684_19290, partial [Gaiellales bacterium]|nr:hypothetical protein [Gaiellales bacterium]
MLTAAPIVLVAVTVVAGYWFRHHQHRRLGAPTAPMYWFGHTRLEWWALPAAAVLVAAVLLGPWALRLERWWFLAAAVVMALATRVTLNMSRHGPHELIGPLVGQEGRHEYLRTVGRFLDDPVGYLRHFPQLVRTVLPIHPSGHPPGPTVLLGGLQEIGLGGAWGATVVILLLGSLTAVPVYLLGRELADEPSARLAVLAWLFAPNVLLMSATSMDAVFAAVSTAAAVLLLRRRAVAGGLATAVASFLSYALLAVPVWAVATLLLRGDRPRVLVPKVCVALAVIAGCYMLLWLLTGYQPYDAYDATKHAYEIGVSGRRPLWFWFFGDIAVFLLGLGLPGLVLWSRALGRLDSAAVALAGTLVLASASGFAKAEVERIWL